MTNDSTMKLYKVEVVQEQFAVRETITDLIVYLHTSMLHAANRANMYESGYGFNGFTPRFMLTSAKVSRNYNG